MKSNKETGKMKKEVYVLRSQVHFGSLKTSIPKGTKVEIDRNSKIVSFDGIEHDNINEVDMMIRAGYIIPYVKDDDVPCIQEKVSKSPEKMDVQKSDLDSMSREIDISNTKKEVREQQRKDAKMPVIKEEELDEVSRGMQVVRNDGGKKIVAEAKADTDKEILQVVNGDDYETVAKIPESKEANKPSFGLSSTEDAKDVAAAINGQEGTVVKKIGKSEATKTVATGNKLTAKHASSASEEKAKAVAAERKAASAARKAKAKK